MVDLRDARAGAELLLQRSVMGASTARGVIMRAHRQSAFTTPRRTVGGLGLPANSEEIPRLV